MLYNLTHALAVNVDRVNRSNTDYKFVLSVEDKMAAGGFGRATHYG